MKNDSMYRRYNGRLRRSDDKDNTRKEKRRKEKTPVVLAVQPSEDLEL